MPRKPLPKNRRRAYQIGVQLTPAERKALEQASTKAGLSKSSYIRNALLTALESREERDDEPDEDS